MKQTIKTSRVAGQLEKMFRALNNRFFDGELPEVVISLKRLLARMGTSPLERFGRQAKNGATKSI